MTLTSQLITDAFRQSNLLAINVQPTPAEVTEALRYLNRIVKSVFGNEAGDPLEPFPIGRSGINRPSGYPWYDDVPDSDWFVPKNTRVMLNLEKSIPIYLTPAPDDGCRFALIDIAGSLNSFPVEVHGNGNRIEGQLSITLDEDRYDAEWFYREDLGTWMKASPLLEADTFPFPEEFDDFFITMLAMRLNPSYGAGLDPQSQEVFRRAKSQLRARYSQHIFEPSELGLLRLAKVSWERDRWGSVYNLYNPNTMFTKGWPL